MPDRFEPSAISLDVDAEGTLSAFEANLRDLQGLADQFGRSLTGAFRQSVVEGRRLDDVLRGLVSRFSDRALSSALAPLQAGIGSLFSGATGAITKGLSSFAGSLGGPGRLVPFARGGVVGAPATFPLAGGTGLIGEAGPEAIMPLMRGADGRLGIRTGAGSGPMTININVTARDADSFRRSEADITSMIARAVRRGQRHL